MTLARVASHLSHRLPLKPMIIINNPLPFLLPFVQDSSASREIPTSTGRTVCALHHIQADSCISALELNCSFEILIHD